MEVKGQKTPKTQNWIPNPKGKEWKICKEIRLTFTKKRWAAVRLQQVQRRGQEEFTEE